MNGGLISGVLQWGAHPSYSKGTITQWLAGLMLVLILAVLWGFVLKEID
jgi:hypothetical protein